MVHTRLSRYIGFVALGCGLMATVIYVLMISVTLAHIEAVSGQVPFDMRPLAYRPEDAATPPEALGADGRAYYLRYPLTLDTVYPSMLSLTLIATTAWYGAHTAGTRPVPSVLGHSLGCALVE